jgi:hypothetical protein
MLLINSIMLTVLPTPAPPNRPTLPPLAKGQTRSMTLMPVSSRSTDGDSSSNFGASWWIPPLVGGNRAGLVDRAPENVHDAADRCIADRHGDAGAGVVDLHATAQAVGRPHGNRADDPVTQLLLDFEHQVRLAHVRFFSLVELSAA